MSQGDGLTAVRIDIDRAIDAMRRAFDSIRVGAASASLLESIRVVEAGRTVRLDDVATVSVPDPRQIMIRPWDPRLLRAIGKAIADSDVDLTPTVDGPCIRLYVPATTADRRAELVRLVHRHAEETRIQIRAVRHDAAATIRREGVGGADEVRRALATVDRLTAAAMDEIDRLGRHKERALLTV